MAGAGTRDQHAAAPIIVIVVVIIEIVPAAGINTSPTRRFTVGGNLTVPGSREMNCRHVVVGETRRLLLGNLRIYRRVRRNGRPPRTTIGGKRASRSI